MNQSITIPPLPVDEKICSSCGESIKIKAEICPRCGVRQKIPVNKALLLVITFFLGGLGAHKFYTGRNWQGIFYLLLCWTGIPGFIALIEFIIYAFTSTDTLQEKYSGSRSGIVIAIIACVFGFIVIAGILAAIAIPQFVAYRNRAFQISVATELQTLIVAEDEYFSTHNRYSNNISELKFSTNNPEITIEIIAADENCFEATGRHSKLEKIITADCNGVE